MHCYPKVLILGQSYDKSGAGITLKNLFKDWPNDKIAVAANEIYVDENTPCVNNYLFGYLERKKPWPICLLQHKKYSGILPNKVVIQNNIIHTSKKNEIRSIILSRYISFQHLIGIYHYMQRINLSVKFVKWLKEYEPDIIYTQLSTLGLIRIVSKIYELTNKPLVIHIMDDWPLTIVKNGLFSEYWRRVIDREFRKLIDKSTALMSICPAMSDEYEIRYGKKFLPFHNPIEVSQWIGQSRRCWGVGEPIKILYAGRLGKITMKSLIDICEAIDILRSGGYNISFDILTSNYYERDIGKLKKYKSVNMLPYLKHSEMPEKLRSVDLLIIPFSFNENNVKFTRYSMPTKTSEYMASGTPILLYAHPDTALVRYAKEGGWGYVVEKENVHTLSEAIKIMITNIEIRESYGKRAVEIAFKNHDANSVRKDFQELLSDVTQNRK